MDLDVFIEVLKNNRMLWVSSTVTGTFAVIVSVLNAFWSYRQKKKQLDYEKRLEDHKSDLDKELENFKNGLGREMESFKSDLERKKYVSNVRFDTEFKLYRDIWSACRKMVSDVYFVYPTYAETPADEELRKEYEQKVYRSANDSFRDFIELLENNAPFIDIKIYNKLKEIGDLCRSNLRLYEMKWNKGILFNWEDSQEKRDAEWKAYERTEEFNQKYKELIGLLRDYLNKLDVGEQEGISK